MSRILVTGGAGFIGSNLIKELINQGHQVISIDNYSTGSKINELKGVKYYELDILEIEDLTEKIDLCFHLAARSSIQPSFNDSKDYFRVNVSGTMKVMNWAKKNNVKVVYAGSSSKHNNPSNSPYAMYKYLGEEICKLYRNIYSLDIEIARFYNVYGHNQSLDEFHGNVIGIWLSKIKKGSPLPIVGSGENRRDFINVIDLVDGLIKIAFSNQKNIDAWELGTGVNHSVNELFNMFNERFTCKSVYVPDQKGNPNVTLRKNNDMLSRLKWKPKDRLKEYIKNI